MSRVIKALCAVLSFLSLLGAPARAGVNDGLANLVLGQADFNTADSAATATSFRGVFFSTFDASGNLWVSDFLNNRVLKFVPPFTFGMAASAALGQPDLVSDASGTTATTLNGPLGLAFDDSGNLWVADQVNNRVLKFPAANLVTGGAATEALGQPDLVSGAPAVSATNLAAPWGLAFDGSGNLWVSDSANNRIVQFDGANQVTGGSAALSLGQADLDTNAPNAIGGPLGPDAADLSAPFGLVFDGSGNLWAADSFNNRVVLYPPASQVQNGAATVVLGQPVVSGAFAPATTAAGLAAPMGIAFDAAGAIFVADSANSRVLKYAPPLTTGMAAAQAYGQPDFTSPTPNRGGNPGPNRLAIPTAVAFDGAGNLALVDDGNNRLLFVDAAANGPAVLDPSSAVSSDTLSFYWNDASASVAPVIVLSTSSSFTTLIASSTASGSSVGQSTAAFPGTGGPGLGYAVVPNTTYYFEVKSSTEPDSYYLSLTTRTLSAPPSGGSFGAVGSSGVSVGWLSNGNPVNFTTYTVALSPTPTLAVNAAGTFVFSTAPFTSGATNGSAASTAVTFSTQSLGYPSATGTLIPNTSYYAFAAARDWVGTLSTFTSLGVFSTLAVPPTTFADLPGLGSQFASISDNSMQVRWASGTVAGWNPLNVTTYTVVLSTQPGVASFQNASDKVTLSSAPIGTVPTATLNGLTAGTVYWLFVSAANNSGTATAYTAMGSVTTTGGAAAPSVSGAGALEAGISSNTLAFSWTNASASVAPVIVLSRSPSFATVIASVTASGTSVGQSTAAYIAQYIPPIDAFTDPFPNTTYYFQVKSSTEADSNYISVATVTFAAPPAKRSDGSFSLIGSSGVTLGWTTSGNPINFTTYTLVLSGATKLTAFALNDSNNLIFTTRTFRAGMPNGDSQSRSVDFSTQTLGYPSAGAALIPNTSYYFYAAASNYLGRLSTFTALGSFSTLAVPPTTFADLPGLGSQLSVVTSSIVTVGWSSGTISGWNTLDFTTYTVVLSPQGGLASFQAATGNVSLSTTPVGKVPSATLKGLLGNTTYWLFVKAVNISGVSTAYTAMSSVTTQSLPPTAAQASFVGLTDATLNWSTATNAAGTYFLVTISSDPTFSAWTATTTVTSSSFTAFANLASGQNHYSQVQAYSYNGNLSAPANLPAVTPEVSPSGTLASKVLGQSDYTSKDSPSPPTAAKLKTPSGILLDGSGNLWVADTDNNRVLMFAPPLSSGMSATLALGQQNLTSAGFATTAQGLSRPSGLALDGSGNLWVQDYGNSRVLMYPAPFATGMAATVVLGEPNFTTNAGDQTSGPTAAPSASRMAPKSGGFPPGPGLTFDGSGNLWVSDFFAHRVLRFSPPFATGMDASYVLGQTDFTSKSPTNTGTANGFAIPTGVAIDDSGNVWVSDFNHHRVMMFKPPFNAGNYGKSADLALGEPDFATISGGTSQSTIFTPQGLAFASGSLWVADNGNNRALRFDPPFTTGMKASWVVGQTDFTSGNAGTTQSAMDHPSAFALDGSGNLWIADTYNSRALLFGGNSASFLVPPLPASPVYGNVSIGSVTVAWTDSANPSGTQYNLNVSTDPLFATLTLSSVTANKSVLVGEGGAGDGGSGGVLASNVRYYFQVQAKAPTNSTAFTSLGSTFTLTGRPTASQIKTVGGTSQVFATSATITWSLAAGDPPTTKGWVDLSTSTDFTTKVTSIVPANLSGAPEFKDERLLGCTTYFYHVASVNGNGVPNGFDLTTIGAPYLTFVTSNTVPTPPTGLIAIAQPGSRILLNWNLSDTDSVSQYKLYWDSGSGVVPSTSALNAAGAPLTPGTTLYAVFTGTVTSYATPALPPSGQYIFKLTSVHGCGVEEAQGAKAAAGAAATLSEVRAVITAPQAGTLVNGGAKAAGGSNSFRVSADLAAGTASTVKQVVFSYQPADGAASSWVVIGTATSIPYAVSWNPSPDAQDPATADTNSTPANQAGLNLSNSKAAGCPGTASDKTINGDQGCLYNLRAVAYDLNGAADAFAASVQVALIPTVNTSDLKTKSSSDLKDLVGLQSSKDNESARKLYCNGLRSADALGAGLYVNVIDGVINLTNRGGSQSFTAGQFGYTASATKSPVVVPANPGIQYTPPPAFSSSKPAVIQTSTGKPKTVDCEVRSYNPTVYPAGANVPSDADFMTLQVSLYIPDVPECTPASCVLPDGLEYTIMMDYLDAGGANGDTGFIAGTSPPLRADQATFLSAPDTTQGKGPYNWDTAVKMKAPDLVNHKLIGTVNHATFFLVAGAPTATDVSSVRVYPVPWKPNGADPSEGRPYARGVPNTGIVFDTLPANFAIKIYSVTGHLVATMTVGDGTGTGQVVWDAKNDSGRDVASGGYFAVISAPGLKSVVKRLAIVR